MADGKDMQSALAASSLRLTAVEEQIVLSGFSKIESRIKEFLKSQDGRKEVMEPYEFS